VWSRSGSDRQHERKQISRSEVPLRTAGGGSPFSRLNISDNGLPAIIDVDVLDPDVRFGTGCEPLIITALRQTFTTRANSLRQ
jgi:hypothetical protein